MLARTHPFFLALMTIAQLVGCLVEPTAPPSLSLETVKTDEGVAHIWLSWSRANQETFREYAVYRGTTAGLNQHTGELIYVTTSVTETSLELQRPLGEVEYYRVFVIDRYGESAGSNLVTLFAPEEDPPADLLADGFAFVSETDAEPETLYFDAVTGLYLLEFTTEIKKIELFDDESGEFLRQFRFIVCSADRPQVLNVAKAGRLRLELSFREGVSGAFELLLSRISSEAAAEISGTATYRRPIRPSGHDIAFFDAEAAKPITLTTSGTDWSGAYGVASDLYVSAYSGDFSQIYIDAAYAGAPPDPQDGYGGPKEFSIEPIEDGRIYLVTVAAYCGLDGNTIELTIDSD